MSTLKTDCISFDLCPSRCGHAVNKAPFLPSRCCLFKLAFGDVWSRVSIGTPWSHSLCPDSSAWSFYPSLKVGCYWSGAISPFLSTSLQYFGALPYVCCVYDYNTSSRLTLASSRNVPVSSDIFLVCFKICDGWPWLAWETPRCWVRHCSGCVCGDIARDD
jgi:hypothetical protein